MTYSGSCNNQRTTFGPASQQSLARSNLHHAAAKVVRIVLGSTIVVDNVSRSRLVADRASIVLDLVLGIDKITPRKTKVLSSRIRLTLEETLRGRGLEAAREAGDWATSVVPNRWWLRRVSRLVRKCYEEC